MRTLYSARILAVALKSRFPVLALVVAPPILLEGLQVKWKLGLDVVGVLLASYNAPSAIGERMGCYGWVMLTGVRHVA